MRRARGGSRRARTRSKAGYLPPRGRASDALASGGRKEQRLQPADGGKERGSSRTAEARKAWVFCRSAVSSASATVAGRTTGAV